MDLVTGGLVLTAVFNFLLAGIILLQAPRTRANVCYACLVISLLIWTGTIFTLHLAQDERLLFVALGTSYTAGLGIALSFWYFAAFFTRRHLSRGLQVVLWGGMTAVAWLIWTSPRFIQGASRSSAGALSLDIGRDGWIFAVCFAVVMFDAFRSLVGRYRVARGEERGQVLAVLLGTLATTILGTTFNVVLVQAGQANFIAWGPVSTVVMVAFIAYAIIRHHLMSIHLVTAELVTFGLILSLLANIMVSPNPLPRLTEAITLQLAIVFGTYLVRVARGEARKRDPDRSSDHD
jgi:hypothetical protein